MVTPTMLREIKLDKTWVNLSSDLGVRYVALLQIAFLNRATYDYCVIDYIKGS